MKLHIQIWNFQKFGLELSENLKENMKKFQKFRLVSLGRRKRADILHTCALLSGKKNSLLTRLQCVESFNTPY
jgi:hypothetical protein